MNGSINFDLRMSCIRGAILASPLRSNRLDGARKAGFVSDLCPSSRCLDGKRVRSMPVCMFGFDAVQGFARVPSWPFGHNLCQAMPSSRFWFERGMEVCERFISSSTSSCRSPRRQSTPPQLCRELPRGSRRGLLPAWDL